MLFKIAATALLLACAPAFVCCTSAPDETTDPQFFIKRDGEAVPKDVGIKYNKWYFKRFMPSDLISLGFIQNTQEHGIAPDFHSKASENEVGVSDVFWSVGKFLDKYRDFISRANTDTEEANPSPGTKPMQPDYSDETVAVEGVVTRAKSSPYYPNPYRYSLLKFKPDDVSVYGPPEPRHRFGFGLGKRR